jgi:flagellar protein FliS
MANNGYNQYLRSKILTASKAELTLMLYEGAIKFCNMAIICIEKKDIPGANTNIKKTEAILEELMSTLNYKYQVATDFKNVYEYLHSRLVEANLKKDTEILNEVLEHLRGMRDTWKEVMRTANVPQKTASS